MIVVAGEALIDRIVRPDGAPFEVPGGGPFNTARTIARLGVPVAFLGCLSTDAAGDILRQALVDDGVDMSFTRTTDAPTTLAVAELDEHGGATYRFETAGTSAPALDVAAVRAAVATNPSAIHVGSLGLVLEPIGSTLVDVLAHIAAGPLVMLDPNCRPAAIEDRASYVERLHRVLGRADVVKASRDDLAYLWPDATVLRSAREILEFGPGALIVTDGPRPVVCHSAGFTFELVVPPIDVVDTVGAGDAFGGAFLARWIERGFGRAQLTDEPAMREAVGFAIEVASVICGRRGADPPHPHELSWPTP